MSRAKRSVALGVEVEKGIRAESQRQLLMFESVPDNDTRQVPIIEKPFGGLSTLIPYRYLE